MGVQVKTIIYLGPKRSTLEALGPGQDMPGPSISSFSFAAFGVTCDRLGETGRTGRTGRPETLAGPSAAVSSGFFSPTETRSKRCSWLCRVHRKRRSSDPAQSTEAERSVAFVPRRLPQARRSAHGSTRVGRTRHRTNLPSRPGPVPGPGTVWNRRWTSTP